MKRIRKTAGALSLPTLTLEGGLFLPDQLEKAALGVAQHQTEADYAIPKGLKLKDEYGRAFQIACAEWKHFAVQMERADLDTAAITQNFVRELLRDAFGYAQIQPVSGIAVADRRYPVSLLAGQVPVVVVPHPLGLDEADPRFAIAGSGSRKKSAFQALQELLNASAEHCWGMVCNGKQLRLLRDAATLTRPSFLEVDLQDLLGGQRFAEFANVWRLLHVSRAPLPSPTARGAGGEGACIWEQWRVAGQEEGARVRKGLSPAVTEALRTLGEGFLQHPGNEALRAALHTGELSKDAYFQQLLRLVYRLIFLFSVEERGLLHGNDDSQEALAARRAYAEGYALARLRDLCLKRRARNRFDDHWQAVRIVFRGLADGERRLALPALGGLFAVSQCPHLDAAGLDNDHLLTALKHLRWASHNGAPAPVDYRNMGPEELGSVYESLLEFDPRPDALQKTFELINTAGNDRKNTGSYYTPDSLVQELIQSALDPVIEQRLASNPAHPSGALLSIRVIDPACGSGHFLLAAARRLAEKLAQLQSPEGAVTPQDYRHALREVVARCIFGVDRNPMALELARTALWLEGYEEGRPLSFLDHHLQCGDALLGLTDLKALEQGIAKDAYKPLSGDDKDVCKRLAKANAAGIKQLERDLKGKQTRLRFDDADSLAALQILEALPENSTQDIAAKETAYRDFLQQAKESRLAHAADLLLGAYLLPKTAETEAHIPTSATLYLALLTDNLDAGYQQQLAAAQAACREAHVLHWPLAFPQVFAAGGFDCVLGNPPWERIKLQEEEFFATRHRDVAEAKNKAERAQRIQWLSEGMLARHLYPRMDHPPHECEAEKRLYAEFIGARRTAEAASLFAHVKGDDGGRYPLTGVGDVNTYALFAETIGRITAPQGRAGFIVPTGIATDDSTKAYFANITQAGRLVSLYDIENREAVFEDVHRSYKFCLLTLGAAEQAEFVCFATRVEQLSDPRRRFRLTPDEFRLINPNTLTCPVFRSERDAELTKKLYRATPVLIEEGKPNGNPWGISFMAMMHMSNDSHLFVDASQVNGEWRTANGELADAFNHSPLTTRHSPYLPLYEAKMIHQFDHRWATYGVNGDWRIANGERENHSPLTTRHSPSSHSPESRDVTLAEKADPHFTVTPRYWVSEAEVQQRLKDKGWSRGWLMGWRDICRATDERTVIASVVPRVATGDTLLLMFPDPKFGPKVACLLADQCSLVHDYVARQKVGGTHLKYHVKKQLPNLSPDRYTETDLAFIVPRVLELTYTAHDLQAWAADLGYEGEPFPFDPERRAQLRAELDAYYARLYGLTRDELRYILDPADVMGEDYPSETFRVLKNNEMRQFGEYRTRRLVLAAWDRLEKGELS
ncbi:Eco57I restriction-modification methylase domain-containing protein [Methylocaldum gracile]|jgi:hypothetical protein|uniref:Eco57I restriction-modification methylase domain-containing protein n=1 Tax=Methylocaldum sp. 0917 TaxID=2485163 RepID=UPI00105F251F